MKTSRITFDAEVVIKDSEIYNLLIKHNIRFELSCQNEDYSTYYLYSLSTENLENFINEYNLSDCYFDIDEVMSTLTII